jgi:predicted nucleic acid-binding protein
MRAAGAYAEMFAARRRAGRPVSTIDLMVAAIAWSHGASVVTRNVTDFDSCGVDIIDPWSSREAC